MLINFSSNPFKQVIGVISNNYGPILFFIILSGTAVSLHNYFEMKHFSISVIPVTILGGGLAIFLGFKNNVAYDRWWEARKIWGAIVNNSRSFGTEVMSLLTEFHVTEESNKQDLYFFQKRMIYRQIAWFNALRIHLLKKNNWEIVKSLISNEEYEDLLKAKNKVTFLNHMQGLDLKNVYLKGFIEDFRHMEMISLVKNNFDHQGKCERIKNTVFPFYYSYFTELFLWLFILLLPFTLVNYMTYMCIPLSVGISFVFYILDKTGNVTEDPFENRASDIPMLSMCKAIEIDLRQQLGEDNIPEPVVAEKTKFGVKFIR